MSDRCEVLKKAFKVAHCLRDRGKSNVEEVSLLVDYEPRTTRRYLDALVSLRMARRTEKTTKGHTRYTYHWKGWPK